MRDFIFFGNFKFSLDDYFLSMTKKKIILILSSVLVIASALAIYVVFKFKLGKEILCYPRDHIKGDSHANFDEIFRPSYYFAYINSVYFHQPGAVNMNGSYSGELDIKLENSDPLSFACIDSNYAKDRNNVYYFGSIVEQADPDTFEPLDWPRARDKNYYFNAAKIEGSVSENESKKNKTSYELMIDLLIRKNSDNEVRAYGLEYYKIFQEVKSPFDGKIAVLFGFDPDKTEGCCSMPIGIFINDNGKIGKEFKILNGALEHMYLDNAEWQSHNALNYDFVIADEGGKTVTVETLASE